MMTRLTTLLILTMALGKAVAASEIEIANLGELSLAYQRASLVTSYPGQNIAAQVTFKKGEAFTVIAPRRIQQIKYLVEVGSFVERGQPLAELRGPELHHFLTEMEVARQLLRSAERRYKSNKVLFEKRAIKESQWAEISEKYYAAQLEYEHMRHFGDLVIAKDEEDDSIVIAAPVSGIVDYALEYNGLVSGADIALIVPKSAIRLEAALPASNRKGLAYLKTPSCELNWSEPLLPQCELILGQTLLVTPLYTTNAYKVPMTAVFQWQGTSSVLVHQGRRLKLVQVELIASSGKDYIVACDKSLENTEVLVSSVSAVQGILIGLGGE